MRLWNLYHHEIPAFLSEAAQTAAMQRLRYIGMNCGCEYTSFPLFTDIEPYSRFDHSMGVALIVWHFTHDKAQAVSGLLHDIATPVFAHVIDFLREDHMKQESTEEPTASLIRNTGEIMQLLTQNGLSPYEVEDYHRYPIADNDSPKLSADRLEYTLGNATNYKILTREQASFCYHDLTVGINEFGEPELAFRSQEAALIFANAALACSRIYVSDADRCAMQSLADLLKQALKLGILSEADLQQTEHTVISKLMQSELSDEWKRFRNYHQIICRETPGKQGCWRQIFAKKRYIDPFIQNAGRTSKLYSEYRIRLDSFLESRQDYWLLIQ